MCRWKHKGLIPLRGVSTHLTEEKNYICIFFFQKSTFPDFFITFANDSLISWCVRCHKCNLCRLFTKTAYAEPRKEEPKGSRTKVGNVVRTGICINIEGEFAWGGKRVATLCRKAFTQRFIATIRTSNTWNPRSRCCNGRCPGMCLYASPFRDICNIMFHISVGRGGWYSYRRGLRSCLSKRGGKFEGQDCEISNGYESHAFFMSCSCNSLTNN